MATSNSDSIAERVRFWEEQDKINQELIPRVIRQNELLTKHIAEHDTLPEVAVNTISEALAEARTEQRQQYEAALDGARTELAEQAQANFQKALDDFRTALSDAKTELGEQTHTSLAQASEHLQTAMEVHRTELNEQAQSSVTEGMENLREESRTIRHVLIGITSGAGAVCIATLIVGLLT